MQASTLWPTDDEERGDSIFEVEVSRDLHVITESGVSMNDSLQDIEGKMNIMTAAKNNGMVNGDGESEIYAPSKTYSLVKINKSNISEVNTSILGDTTYTYVTRPSFGSSSALIQQGVQVDIRGASIREEGERSAKTTAVVAQSNTVMLNMLDHRGLDGFVEKLVDGELG